MPVKGGDIVPIRWNAKRVEEAADMLEEEVNKIKEPLESVKAIAEEALKIPNIPEYVQQSFHAVLSEVERSIGGVNSWNKEPFPGNFARNIERIRKSIPANALKAVEAREKYGSTTVLV